ncbi:hypothetical protein [Streptomyces sp. NPDC048191]|uniref:hypothetical protein n=1 Tax=Streptomyces sp. NPDC048191 TaxID=3155484 RepID=UPI0033F31C4A
MRETVHRRLGKSVAGAALATVEAAARAAITLPCSAGAEEQAPAEHGRGTGRDPLTDDEIRRAGRTAPIGPRRA